MFAALASAVILAAISTPHCAVMCGPLATCARADRGRRALRYHLGRALGYGALGFAAGAAGHSLASEVFWLPVLAAWAVAAALWIGAVTMWRGARARPAVVTLRRRSRLSQLLARVMGTRPGLCGGLTALLPCGVLWAAAALALSTGSATGGAVLMIVFAVLSGLAVAVGAAALGQLRTRLGPRPLAIAFALAGSVFVILPLPSLVSADNGVDGDESSCPWHASEPGS